MFMDLSRVQDTTSESRIWVVGRVPLESVTRSHPAVRPLQPWLFSVSHLLVPGAIAELDSGQC